MEIMEHPTSVYELISLWPSRAELADDISTTDERVKVDRVHKWAQNGAIPQKFMSKIVKAAKVRSLPITAQSLLDIHENEAEATGR